MSPSLEITFLLSLAEKYRPVGVRLLSVRVTLGGIAPCLIEHWAVGLVLVTGLIPTGRIPPQASLVKLALDVN
jgi:hypothetical protein